MPPPHRRARVRPTRAAAFLASLLALWACADDDGDGSADPAAHTGAPAESAPSTPGDDEPGASTVAGASEAAELGRLLERAAAGALSESQREALEASALRVLEPAAGGCDGCRAEVAWSGAAEGAGFVQCELHRGGQLVAELELFYRPDLPAGVAGSWGRRRLRGYPASGWEGRHLFVWPGRFEIRAFARDGALEGEERLAGLLEALPLDALARL